MKLGRFPYGERILMSVVTVSAEAHRVSPPSMVTLRDARSSYTEAGPSVSRLESTACTSDALALTGMEEVVSSS